MSRVNFTESGAAHTRNEEAPRGVTGSAKLRRASGRGLTKVVDCFVCGKPFDNELWLLGNAPDDDPEPLDRVSGNVRPTKWLERKNMI